MQIAQLPARAGTATLLATPETWAALKAMGLGVRIVPMIDSAIAATPEGKAVRVTMPAETARQVLTMAATINEERR